MACGSIRERARSQADLIRLNLQYAGDLGWTTRPGGQFSGPGDPTFGYACLAFQQTMAAQGDPPADCTLDGICGNNTLALVRRHPDDAFSRQIVLPENNHGSAGGGGGGGGGGGSSGGGGGGGGGLPSGGNDGHLAEAPKKKSSWGWWLLGGTAAAAAGYYGGKRAGWW